MATADYLLPWNWESWDKAGMINSPELFGIICVIRDNIKQPRDSEVFSIHTSQTLIFSTLPKNIGKIQIFSQEVCGGVQESFVSSVNLII